MPNSGAVMTHFLQRSALIALATGALGACSTTDPDALRPSYPVRAPEAAAPAPAPTPAPTPAPAPPPPVTSETLPPPAALPAPVEGRPLAPVAPLAPRAAPPPPAPPPPLAFRTVTTRSVTGKVVQVE